MPERSVLIQATFDGLVKRYGASCTFVSKSATRLSSSLFDPRYDDLRFLEQEINIYRGAAILVHHFMQFLYKLIASEQDEQLRISLRLLGYCHSLSSWQSGLLLRRRWLLEHFYCVVIVSDPKLLFLLNTGCLKFGAHFPATRVLCSIIGKGYRPAVYTSYIDLHGFIFLLPGSLIIIFSIIRLYSIDIIISYGWFLIWFFIFPSFWRWNQIRFVILNLVRNVFL